MRKLMFITVFCAMVVTPAFAGPTVKLYQLGEYSYGNGGEFTANPSGWNWDPLQYYSDSTKNQEGYIPSFQTFCLERSEYFYPGTEYDVLFGDKAIKGGVGPQGDPISLGTAWLYHEFQKGALEGYDYTPGTDRSASARALQTTIWWLEGEVGSNPGNIFSQAVIAKFDNAVNAMADNNWTYPVAVMTLWDKGYAGDLNHYAQDMLVCIPAPSAVLLGSLGVGLVGWLRKRRFLQ